ncbi:hypothetical protein HHA01_23810 [Halomonas halmophila]|uniref:Uncharacterized protein n=1 Tax=Halomonas halmophila TaxID=252 RepID=A0A4Y4F6C0_9GAMM|nr:hypothetical protein HHA01_23810 [Halomonas halmophila]
MNALDQQEEGHAEYQQQGTAWPHGGTGAAPGNQGPTPPAAMQGQAFQQCDECRHEAEGINLSVQEQRGIAAEPVKRGCIMAIRPRDRLPVQPSGSSRLLCAVAHYYLMTAPQRLPAGFGTEAAAAHDALG